MRRWVHLFTYLHTFMQTQMYHDFVSEVYDLRQMGGHVVWRLCKKHRLFTPGPMTRGKQILSEAMVTLGKAN